MMYRKIAEKLTFWITVGYLLMPVYLAIYHVAVGDNYLDFWWVLTIIFGALALANGAVRFWPHRKEHHMLIMLGIALLVSLISMLCAHDIGLAFWGDSYLHVGWLLYLILAGFFLNSLSLSKDEIAKIAKIFVVISTAVCLVSLMNNRVADGLFLSEYYPRQTKESFPYHGIFANANHFAYYLTICATLAASIFVKARERKEQIVYFCCFVVLTIMMALSNTVGGYFGLLAGLIVLIIGALWSERRIVIWKCLAIIAVIICACLIPYNNHKSVVGRNINDAFGGRAAVEGREATIADYGTGRIEIWQDTLKYINRKPLLGYGGSGLALEFKRDRKTPDAPHNLILELAAYNGIVVAVLIVGFLGWLMWLNASQLHKGRAANWTVPAIVAYLVSALFGNMTFFVSPILALFLGACYIYSIDKHKR